MADMNTIHAIRLPATGTRKLLHFTLCLILLVPLAPLRAADPPAPAEVLDGVRDFFRKTAQPDGSAGPVSEQEQAMLSMLLLQLLMGMEPHGGMDLQGVPDGPAPIAVPMGNGQRI